MEKERKKEIVSEYKQRETKGEVYKITNKTNQRYMIKAEIDLESFKNRFDFSQKTNTCINPKMLRDHSQVGSVAFELEILAEIIKKNDESNMAFKDRLKKLAKDCAEKFDKTLSY